MHASINFAGVGLYANQHKAIPRTLANTTDLLSAMPRIAALEVVDVGAAAVVPDGLRPLCSELAASEVPEEVCEVLIGGGVWIDSVPVTAEM